MEVTCIAVGIIAMFTALTLKKRSKTAADSRTAKVYGIAAFAGYLAGVTGLVGLAAARLPQTDAPQLILQLLFFAAVVAGVCTLLLPTWKK